MQLCGDRTTRCANTSDHDVPELPGYCRLHTLLCFQLLHLFLLQTRNNFCVEQMLRRCAYVVLFLFYLLSHCIVSHTTLDTGPYVALWSGNVFERINVVFTEILTKLNTIMAKPFFLPAHKRQHSSVSYYFCLSLNLCPTNEAERSH